MQKFADLVGDQPHPINVRDDVDLAVIEVSATTQPMRQAIPPGPANSLRSSTIRAYHVYLIFPS